MTHWSSRPTLGILSKPEHRLPSASDNCIWCSLPTTLVLMFLFKFEGSLSSDLKLSNPHCIPTDHLCSAYCLYLSAFLNILNLSYLSILLCLCPLLLTLDFNDFMLISNDNNILFSAGHWHMVYYLTCVMPEEDKHMYTCYIKQDLRLEIVASAEVRPQGLPPFLRLRPSFSLLPVGGVRAADSSYSQPSPGTGWGLFFPPWRQPTSYDFLMQEC